MRLRELEDSDIEIMKVWLNKPHVSKWFKHQEAWLDEIKNRKTKYDFIKHFIVLEDNKDIGFAQYYDYAKGQEDWHGFFPPDGSYSIDYLIGDENYLNKGYGTKIVKQLTNDIISNTDAKRIIVQPEKDNEISRRTLLSAGYCYDNVNDVFYKDISK